MTLNCHYKTKNKHIPRTLIHSSSPIRASHSLKALCPPPLFLLLPFSPHTLQYTQRVDPSFIHSSSLILVISSNTLKVVRRLLAQALPLRGTLSSRPHLTTVVQPLALLATAQHCSVENPRAANH